jgi:hypothetical protein
MWNDIWISHRSEPAHERIFRIYLVQCIYDVSVSGYIWYSVFTTYLFPHNVFTTYLFTDILGTMYLRYIYSGYIWYSVFTIYMFSDISGTVHLRLICFRRYLVQYTYGISVSVTYLGTCTRGSHCYDNLRGKNGALTKRPKTKRPTTKQPNTKGPSSKTSQLQNVPTPSHLRTKQKLKSL